jgi:hypothetical protein
MDIYDHDEENFIKLSKNTFDVVPIAKLFFVRGILETRKIDYCELSAINLGRINVRKLCDGGQCMLDDVFVASVFFFFRLNLVLVAIECQVHF